jgi:hypothetical protein
VLVGAEGADSVIVVTMVSALAERRSSVREAGRAKKCIVGNGYVVRGRNSIPKKVFYSL